MKRSKRANGKSSRGEQLRNARCDSLEIFEGSKELQRDPWLNPRLLLDIDRAQAVALVVEGVAQYGERKRALKQRDRQTLDKLLWSFTTNLIHHHLCGSPGDGFPVPRSKRDKALGGEATRYEPFVFPRSFPKTLDALCALGFAEQTIGSYSGVRGRSKRTTVKAGVKLIELIEEHKVTLEDLYGGDGEEVIILKRSKRGHWDEGQRIDYRDTDTTCRFRAEVRAINVWLAKADIRFDPAAHDQKVNVQARNLRRIFTRGQFDRGGRLFGGFWENLPKDVRLRGISIEGEKVIGLDYSQLNPLLAYHLANAAPPSGDAYTLPDLEKHRDGVKQVFNAMLFHHPVKKFPKGARALFPKLVKCRDVTGAILQRHPKLKGVISSDEVGHQLQFLESEIMMSVLRKCQRRRIVALPVFDCVVVKATLEKDVREIMKREFKARTGLKIEVKRETAGQ